MPYRDFLHDAGKRAPAEIARLVTKHFGATQLERLERLGGRLRISLTIPFKDVQSRGKAGQDIDDEFVARLREVKDSRPAIEDIISGLTVKQLRSLAGKLEHPLRSGATAQQIRQELIRSLQSESIWDRIAGSE